MTTLAEHIKHAENYRKCRKVFQQYKQEKLKKRDAFHQTHFADIILYEAAEKYLKAHLNGYEKIPLAKWKSEVATLTAEKDNLYQDYYRLKNEVKEIEVIRRSVEHVVNIENLKTVSKIKSIGL